MKKFKYVGVLLSLCSVAVIATATFLFVSAEEIIEPELEKSVTPVANLEIPAPLEFKSDNSQIVSVVDQAYIYNKMLNTLDYFSTAEGTFVTNMINLKTETSVSFVIDIPNEFSYEKATDENNNIETFYSNSRVNTYNNKQKTLLSLICGEQFDDDEKLSGENRIWIEDTGDKCYYYRANTTNLPYASQCVLPQEMTFGLLADKSLWQIDGFEKYMGFNCVVITGTTEKNYGAKLNTHSFIFYVDEATGILLKYEGYDINGELTGYIFAKEMSINQPVNSSVVNDLNAKFSDEIYASYVDLVKQSMSQRQNMLNN